MHNFSDLLRKIRESSSVTQAELAGILGVSPILISMLETGRKQVSKKLILKLADRLEVNSNSITPFLFYDNSITKDLSLIEKKIIKIGEELQYFLIEKKAKNLRKYL